MATVTVAHLSRPNSLEQLLHPDLHPMPARRDPRQSIAHDPRLVHQLVADAGLLGHRVDACRWCSAGRKQAWPYGNSPSANGATRHRASVAAQARAPITISWQRYPNSYANERRTPHRVV